MANGGSDNGERRRRIEVIVLVALVSTFVVVSALVHRPDKMDHFTKDMISIILAAGLTLIMYSFLYRDNPLFKIAENLYVGVTLGYGIIISWQDSLRPEVFEPLFMAPTTEAFWSAISERSIPIILGLVLLMRLSKKRSWLSRYSYAPMVGWGAGFLVATTVKTSIFKQLQAAIMPLQRGVSRLPKAELPEKTQAFIDWLAHGLGQDTALWLVQVGLPILGAVVLLVGTVAVLYYFFFSLERKRLGQATSHVGIWFLMVSFGATFGFTVMGRLALLIDRVDFLLFEWLQISQ